MKSIWSKIRKLESQSYSTRIDRRKERKCTQRDLPKSLWISRTQIRLVLTFLRSFLPTLILEFSGSLLPILTSSAMQLIATTSPLPTVQMAATYRPIYVLKRCRKSGGTLQTCPDLPAIISRNFDFRVFEHIFGNLIPSSDLSWNAADLHNFTATGNADYGDISPDLCSEAF